MLNEKYIKLRFHEGYRLRHQKKIGVVNIVLDLGFHGRGHKEELTAHLILTHFFQSDLIEANWFSRAY